MMITQSPRLLLRASHSLCTIPTRRFLSTAPPAQKSRSWKSFTARLGLAFGAVYYYNTSQLFAEEPPFSIPPPQEPTQETSLHTLESIAQRNRTPPPPTPALTAAHVPKNAGAKSERPANKDLAPLEDTAPNPTPPANEAPPSSYSSNIANPNPTPPAKEGLEATEEEASQEGAFNEETGEINWDCPCLGGMAHGPCGEQFRGAFSCFVYSKDEPKGMDCIPNFKNMQDCFREYPDVYGAELEDDEGPESEDAPAPVSAEGREVPAAALSTDSAPARSQSPQSPPSASSSMAREDTQIGSTDEGNVLVPKAAHDATGANPQTLSTNPAPAPTPSSRSPPSTSSSTVKEDTQLWSTDEGNVLVPKAAHDATGADTEN